MRDEKFLIDGPAGPIEARLTGPDGPATAVLCHPHPLYGGSMHDGVLAILADALAGRGIASLRFNFRGVGGSAGAHDSGRGELEDLRAVVHWLVGERPGGRLLLGGYSFGASIVARLLAEAPEGIERALLIAPPVGNLPMAAPDGRIPVDVFVGDADPFVDPEALSGWTEASVHLLPGADHFFNGCWETLTATIGQALDA